MRSFRRKTKNMTKIVIQSNQCTSFFHNRIENNIIRLSSESFFTNSFYIMPGSSEQFQPSFTDVLIQLEFHADVSVGTGMIRSRAASAPYPIAARISSCVNWGYSLRISCSLIPLARKSRINETQMRVPLIHGFPKHIFGLMLIRSNKLAIFILLSLNPFSLAFALYIY